jgi:hypothetical protein
MAAGEIRPVARTPWGAPDSPREESQPVIRVTGAEGGTAARVRDFSLDRGGGLYSAPPEFSSEVISQLEVFLQENMGLDLSFVTGKSGTVVRVLDKRSGKLVREIPMEKLARFRGKAEDLRGILFDGKA